MHNMSHRETGIDLEKIFWNICRPEVLFDDFGVFCFWRIYVGKLHFCDRPLGTFEKLKTTFLLFSYVSW